MIIHINLKYATLATICKRHLARHLVST